MKRWPPICTRPYTHFPCTSLFLSRYRDRDGMRDKIPGDYSLLAFGRNHDRAVSRGVARRRLKTDLINNDVIGVDEERQAGIEYGGDGVGHDGDRVAMIVCAKMLEFSLGEDLSGIGKGRHPCSHNRPEKSRG